MADDLDFGATIKGFSSGQKVLNRYTLDRILGRGGMGVVWLARDEELGREVALKFLPEVVASDRAALDDMKREVRRAIDLAHPNIVKIHDFVTDGRVAAVSMEYLAGQTLGSLRLDEPGQVFSPDRLAPWLNQLCGALDYAHSDAQVVHRDLKPANLMVDGRGRAKILDFGIAASLSESVTRVSKQAGSSGTPVYMSPQQMMGETPAATDDIYAIGATMFELLTGKPPFYSGNVLLQVREKKAPTMASRRAALGLTAEPIPAVWEEVVAACLAKDPAERPQTAGEIIQRLAGHAAPVNPPPRPATVVEPPQPAAATPTPALAVESPPPVAKVWVLVLAGLGFVLPFVQGLGGELGGFVITAALGSIVSWHFAQRSLWAWPIKLISLLSVIWLYLSRGLYPALFQPVIQGVIIVFGLASWLRAARSGMVSRKEITALALWARMAVLGWAGLAAVLMAGAMVVLPNAGTNLALQSLSYYVSSGLTCLGLLLAARMKIECWPVWLMGSMVALVRVFPSTMGSGATVCSALFFLWGWRKWRQSLPASAAAK